VWRQRSAVISGRGPGAIPVVGWWCLGEGRLSTLRGHSARVSNEGHSGLQASLDRAPASRPCRGASRTSRGRISNASGPRMLPHFEFGQGTASTEPGFAATLLRCSLKRWHAAMKRSRAALSGSGVSYNTTMSTRP
jgi:hypothetical protein